MTQSHALHAHGNLIKLQPYWEDARPEELEQQSGMIPTRVDVVVVGAGLTGVEAARVIAHGGRKVLVLDSGRPGAGASTRNAGQVGRNFKHAFGELCDTLGLDTAKRYFGELNLAYSALADLGEENALSIGWKRCSRVIGALTDAHRDRLHAEFERRERLLGEQVEFLSAEHIGDEFGSAMYKGGVRIVDNGAVHPGLYYEFMHNRAVSAGAQIVGHSPVQGIARTKDGFEVMTRRGSIYCRDVMIATNGYTDAALGWFQQRLAPINAYMIATEALPDSVWAAVLPNRRTYHDNRRRSHFMTFTPDGSRLLFGGRTGNDPSSLQKTAAALEEDLRFIFPTLKDVKITHAWTGRCAGTRDLFPHTGVNPQGMHYALGYCFSGNAMGPYLARKAAARILGRYEEAHSLFDNGRFAKLPLAARNRWTMPLLLNYYAWADRPKGMARAI